MGGGAGMVRIERDYNGKQRERERERERERAGERRRFSLL